jgi:hypothetical protein
MKPKIRIALWIATAGTAAYALAMYCDVGSSDAASRGMGQACGVFFGLLAAGAAIALLLGQRWGRWRTVAGVILGLPLLLVVVAIIGNVIGDWVNQREKDDMQSGRADFRDQPALLAVAQAVSRNDEAAIRAAAKNVPDLQAAGLDGKTLLYFAVDHAVAHPKFVKAVEVLLSLGADPNYNNGKSNSFALWRAVDGEARLLRAMLDAGGNPNGPDFRGDPIVFCLWDGNNRYPADRPLRLRLLLDRGADVNSTLPKTNLSFKGYTLLLYRTRVGVIDDPTAYTDAIELLERGADSNRVADDGMTLVKMLVEHRAKFSQEKTGSPAEFNALVDWLKAHGVDSVAR